MQFIFSFKLGHLVEFPLHNSFRFSENVPIISFLLQIRRGYFERIHIVICIEILTLYLLNYNAMYLYFERVSVWTCFVYNIMTIFIYSLCIRKVGHKCKLENPLQMWCSSFLSEFQYICIRSYYIIIICAVRRTLNLKKERRNGLRLTKLYCWGRRYVRHNDNGNRCGHCRR